MNFITPERMCGYMFVGYCIVYGFRLNFIRKVKTKMDDFGVCDLYYINRSIFPFKAIHFYRSFPVFLLHVLYYLFLICFPFIYLIPFAKQYKDVSFGFVLLVFYSAEFVIEKLFFLLEKHVKYEALMFCIFHLVSSKLYDKKMTNDEKIEYIKTKITWRHRYLPELEEILEKNCKREYPWL